MGEPTVILLQNLDFYKFPKHFLIMAFNKIYNDGDCGFMLIYLNVFANGFRPLCKKGSKSPK